MDQGEYELSEHPFSISFTCPGIVDENKVRVMVNVSKNRIDISAELDRMEPMRSAVDSDAKK